MKRIIALLVVWSVVLQLAFLEGYISTKQMEQEERLRGGAERHAQGTSGAEYREREQVLDNAHNTERDEAKERAAELRAEVS